MGLFDPFKTFLDYSVILYELRGMLLALTVFMYGLDASTSEWIPYITTSSLFKNDNICTCIMTLSAGNLYIYNTILSMTFFIAHSGILSANHYYHVFRTWGSFWYDIFYAIVSVVHFSYVMHYWQPINSDKPLFVVPENLRPAFYLLHFLGLALVTYAPLYLKFWVEANEGKICTDNIFKYIRHPTYSGFFMVFASQTVWTHGSLLFSGLMAAYCHLATFYNEEIRMVEIFGSPYEEYCEKVPAYCPVFRLKKTKDE